MTNLQFPNKSQPTNCKFQKIYESCRFGNCYLLKCLN